MTTTNTTSQDNSENQTIANPNINSQDTVGDLMLNDTSNNNQIEFIADDNSVVTPLNVNDTTVVASTSGVNTNVPLVVSESNVVTIDQNLNDSVGNQSQIPTMTQFIELKKSLTEMQNLIKNINAQHTQTLQMINNQNANAANALVNQNNHSVPITTAEPNSNMDQVSVQIQNAVQQHTNTLINNGDQQGVSQCKYDDITRSIDIKVSDKLKSKIWAREYVDLGNLLDPNYENHDTLQVIGSEGEFRLAPKKSGRKIQNLGQWCDSFMIYLTVYSRKFPEEVPQMTTYLHQMKTLSNKGGDYLYYDEEFRYLRAKSNIGWDIIPDLWLECRDVRSNRNKSQRNNNSNFRDKNYNFHPNYSKQVHPAGYCYRYHNTGQCSNPSCTFKHFCYNNGCNIKHPVFTCSKSTFKRDFRNQNSASSTTTGGNSNKT